MSSDEIAAGQENGGGDWDARGAQSIRVGRFRQIMNHHQAVSNLFAGFICLTDCDCETSVALALLDCLDDLRDEVAGYIGDKTVVSLAQDAAREKAKAEADEKAKAEADGKADEEGDKKGEADD